MRRICHGDQPLLKTARGNIYLMFITLGEVAQFTRAITARVCCRQYYTGISQLNAYQNSGN